MPFVAPNAASPQSVLMPVKPTNVVLAEFMMPMFFEWVFPLLGEACGCWICDQNSRHHRAKNEKYVTPQHFYEHRRPLKGIAENMAKHLLFY